MQETYTNFFSLRISEPVTLLTNWLITIICVVICLTIKKRNYTQESTKLWYLFFLFMGYSVFVGGIYHGFLAYLGDVGYKIVWSATQVLSGFSMYFAQRATLETNNMELSNREKVKKIILLQMIAFILLVVFYQKFFIVTINTAITFIPILIANVMTYKKGERQSGWVALAILVMLLTAIVFVAKISISRWFNHKDISHVLMCLSLYIFFIGVNVGEKQYLKK